VDEQQTFRKAEIHSRQACQAFERTRRRQSAKTRKKKHRNSTFITLFLKMKFKPKMMEKVEHVTVAHAGASYNPDFDDHQALLRQEHNKEFKKVKSQDSYKAKAKPKSKSCKINLQIF
jgi:hypothetical protein